MREDEGRKKAEVRHPTESKCLGATRGGEEGGPGGEEVGEDGAARRGEEGK